MNIFEPRHLWRRLLAFAVDFLLVSLAVTLVLLPLADGGSLRLGRAPFASVACAEPQPATEQIAALLAPVRVDGIRVCTRRTLGFIDDGALAEVYFDGKVTRNGGVTRTSFKQIVLAVDAEGRVIRALWPHTLLTVLVLILTGAWLSSRGIRSPGKRLAGLAVRGDGCALCREMVRLGPLLLASLLWMLLALFMPDLAPVISGAPIWTLMAGGAAFWLLLAAYYLHPVLRWTGAMPWDRRTGFWVARA